MLIGSFFLGKLQQERQSDQTIRALVLQSSDIKQTAMLSLMENRSASKRIQGVNYMEEFSDPDDLIMEALVRRMLFDENNNVRLAAVNALQPFNNLAPVTSAYIKALETEKDPRIQLALIRILVSIREKNAIPPMRQLLEDSQTETFVKDHIKSLLPTIV
jgi:HEAT repeat protein